MAETQSRKGGAVRTVAKKALEPLAHAAVTAGTAYLTRKAMQLWREKLQPQLEKKGGGRALAKETLQNVADKASDVAGKAGEVTGGQMSSSREAERRGREQRRKQRRRAVEKSGSS
jgi:hypothetical protein